MRIVSIDVPRWRWWAMVVVAAAVGLWPLLRSPEPTPDTVTLHAKIDRRDAAVLGTEAAGDVFALRGSAGDVEVLQLAPLFARPGAAFHRELGAWWRVTVRASDRDAALARLRADPRVVSAFVPPQPELPVVMPPARTDGDSCPIKTPLYERRQGYLAAAPEGVDAAAAWAVPGGKGDGVWFADVEGAWNARHEDIQGRRMVHAGGRQMLTPGWRAHGTAVVGEVAAVPNELGMVGITPNVERIVTASIGRIGAAAAIDLAAAELRSGDVLLIELHSIGPRGVFLPVEFWDDVFDAVKAATDRGIIVVAAAGNGAEDLDDPAYRGKLDRTVRDSGAILVGAGAPAHPGYTDRSRLPFSNYGSRVDVQGWGREVATFDYGDLQGCDAPSRKYTARFGGTSSASPIVAASAIALQGIARQRGHLLSPREMRALLSDTGSPQTDGPDGGTEQQIGPRPNLAAAIDALGAR